MAKVPSLKLHSVHGGPSQRRKIEPLAHEVIASLSAADHTQEEYMPAIIRDKCLVIDFDFADEDIPLRVPLVRSVVHPGPVPRTLLLKCFAGAYEHPRHSSSTRACNRLPLEVANGGSETYLCRACLCRGLCGFRCRLVGIEERDPNAIHHRLADHQWLCPTCAAQGSQLDTWLFEVDSSNAEGLEDEMAMQLMYATLASAGAMRSDLDSSFQVSGTELGRGSNAVVHRAKRRMPLPDGTEDDVVVKFFAASPEKDADKVFSAVMKEVFVLTAVQGHPNIIGFQGLFCRPSSGDFTWPVSAKLAMMIDFCSSGDLFDVLRAGTLREDEAADISRDVLSALSHVHSAGFVHRDVKIENILLAADGRAILADFGLACMQQDWAEMVRRCGSPGYCAPEIIQGSPYDETIDVFALGVVIYACVTNAMPFTGASIDETFRNTRKCRVRFTSGAESNGNALSASCKSFLRQLLVKSNLERPSCQDALQHDWLQFRANEVCNTFEISHWSSEASTCASSSSGTSATRLRTYQDSTSDAIAQRETLEPNNGTIAKTEGRQFQDGETREFDQGADLGFNLHPSAIAPLPVTPPRPSKGIPQRRIRLGAFAAQARNSDLGMTGAASTIDEAQSRPPSKVAFAEAQKLEESEEEPLSQRTTMYRESEAAVSIPESAVTLSESRTSDTTSEMFREVPSAFNNRLPFSVKQNPHRLAPLAFSEIATSASTASSAHSSSCATSSAPTSPLAVADVEEPRSPGGSARMKRPAILRRFFRQHPKLAEEEQTQRYVL